MPDPRPNLFVIGAMKSGTSYLSELLRAHPAIFMSTPKEPSYFVDPKTLRRHWPYMWQQGYWKSEQRYLSLFAMAGSAAVIGEASTAYTKVPTYMRVPERILEFSPHARFIYIMRDPVERTISHYWHAVRSSRERRSMLVAIQSDPEYTDVSHYTRQLHEYFSRVRRESLYLLTFEELLANPGLHVSRIYAWLGVDPSVPLPEIGAKNVTPAVINHTRGLGLLDRLRQSSWYGKVEPYVPRAARRLGSQLAARKVKPAEVRRSEVEAYLRLLQITQTEELCRLLSRTFPEWTTLYRQS
jgi:Sulfotransferase family